jgi:hypothetical protein
LGFGRIHAGHWRKDHHESEGRHNHWPRFLGAAPEAFAVRRVSQQISSRRKKRS